MKSFVISIIIPKKQKVKDRGPSQRKGEVEIRTDKGNHQGKKTK